MRPTEAKMQRLGD